MATSFDPSTALISTVSEVVFNDPLASEKKVEFFERSMVTRGLSHILNRIRNGERFTILIPGNADESRVIAAITVTPAAMLTLPKEAGVKASSSWTKKPPKKNSKK